MEFDNLENNVNLIKFTPEQIGTIKELAKSFWTTEAGKKAIKEATHNYGKI